jgi:hypothetical protein
MDWTRKVNPVTAADVQAHRHPEDYISRWNVAHAAAKEHPIGVSIGNRSATDRERLGIQDARTFPAVISANTPNKIDIFMFIARHHGDQVNR